MDGEAIDEPAAYLPQMSEGEHVVEDYVAMRLTLRAHPIAFLRHKLTPGMARLDPGPGKGGPGIDRATGLIRTDIWGAAGGDPDPRRTSVRH